MNQSNLDSLVSLLYDWVMSQWPTSLLESTRWYDLKQFREIAEREFNKEIPMEEVYQAARELASCGVIEYPSPGVLNASE